MSRTRKPCPACKNVEPSRGADEICYHCKALMAEARLLNEQREREFPAVRVVPGASHWLPYIHYAGEAGRDTQKAFRALCVLVGKHLASQSCKQLHPEQQSDFPRDDNVYAFQDGVPEALVALYDMIMRAAAAAYKDGYKDGQNLLTRIAKGDMSVEDINKVTMRAA